MLTTHTDVLPTYNFGFEVLCGENIGAKLYTICYECFEL
jgi:hypothetical protein